MRPLIRWTLVVVMLAAGLGKFLGGYRADDLLPLWAVRPAALLDLVAAAMLVWRPLPWGAGIVAGIGLAGALSAYLFPLRRCGCLGAIVDLSPAAHVVLASSCALGAGLMLFLGRSDAKTPPRRDGLAV